MASNVVMVLFAPHQLVTWKAVLILPSVTMSQSSDNSIVQQVRIVGMALFV